MDKNRYSVTVLCFYQGGEFQKEIEEAGIRVIALGKSGRWDILSFCRHLISRINELQPHVLYSFLSVPNFLAVFLKLFFPGLRIIFGMRAADIDLTEYDWTFRFSHWLELKFSRLADKMIVNSNAGREYYLQRGIPTEKMIVVPNGIDINSYLPDPEARKHLRHEWKIPETSLLVGMIGRLDPMKDHPNFLHAAAELLAKNKNYRFVCVGNGSERYRQKMIQLGTAYGLHDSILWSKGRNDMSAVYNALDVCCSSSAYGEGFSNVLGEAMACGIPCVVTDVGDSSHIIGKTGRVVPPGNPHALAEAIDQIVQMPKEGRQELGRLARQRIERNFTLQKMISSTESVIDSLARKA
jgi:glycosyltransferase involved in cell wall biosynthesis